MTCLDSVYVNKDQEIRMEVVTRQIGQISIDSIDVTEITKNNTEQYDFNGKNLENIIFKRP